MEELRALQNRITELEKENAYLKSLLDNAGISYSAIEPVLNSTQELYDKNQGDRIIPVQITHNHVRAFFSYFCGRMDVFSKRWFFRMEHADSLCLILIIMKRVQMNAILQT